MSEQPVKDPGDDTTEPTPSWAPPADPVARPIQPEELAAESFGVEPGETAETMSPLAPPEDSQPAVETELAAEPESGLPEPVAEEPVEPETAPVEPQEAWPEPVTSEPQYAEPAPAEEFAEPEPEPESAPARAVLEPEPYVAEPVASEPAVAVPLIPEHEPEPDVTAPTTPIGYSETVVVPTGPVTPDPTQAIFRDSPVDAIPDPYADPMSEEAQKLAAERAARKEARDAALAATAPVPVVTPEPVVIKQRTNDKFFGALGVFLLRLVVAGIFGIRGYQMLGDLAATQERLASTLLAPYAQILAIVIGSVHLAIALALILGLLTRVAGLGVALVAGGALGLVWWGPWSPFVAGQAGFLGELELLLTAVGVLLLFIGGGGWSIDRSFRSARARDKAARQLAP